MNRSNSIEWLIKIFSILYFISKFNIFVLIFIYFTNKFVSSSPDFLSPPPLPFSLLMILALGINLLHVSWGWTHLGNQVSSISTLSLLFTYLFYFLDLIDAAWLHDVYLLLLLYFLGFIFFLFLFSFLNFKRYEKIFDKFVVWYNCTYVLILSNYRWSHTLQLGLN